MTNVKYLQDPVLLPASTDEANGTYHVDEGVLVETGDGLKPQTHMAHEQQAAEEGTFSLRTGPTPEGYVLPDTSTITIRKATP